MKIHIFVYQWWHPRFLLGVAKLGFVGRKKSEIFPGVADYRKAQVFHPFAYTHAHAPGPVGESLGGLGHNTNLGGH